MNTVTIAGHAGRITGTTIQVARQLNSQIDWREVITITALGLVTLVLMTYEAGRITGATIHRLNDWLAREWVSALGLIERPPATIKESLTVPAAWAPQPVPAPIAPMPPMARAVALVRCTGCSQRQAAKRAGVSRTQLQRALAAA
jgi:hypothetical protein